MRAGGSDEGEREEGLALRAALFSAIKSYSVGAVSEAEGRNVKQRRGLSLRLLKLKAWLRWKGGRWVQDLYLHFDVVRWEVHYEGAINSP